MQSSSTALAAANRAKPAIAQPVQRKSTGTTVSAQKSTDDYKQRAAQGWAAYEADKAAQQQEIADRPLWLELLINNANAYTYASPDTSFIGNTMGSVRREYATDTSYREPKDDWGSDEKERFGYLYGENKAAAWQYAEQVNNAKAKAKADAEKKQVEQAATANLREGTKHTGKALMATAFGAAELLDNIAEFSARGTITTKDGLTPLDYSQAVTGSITEKLNSVASIPENVPVIGGRGLGDLYQMGFEGAQTGVSYLTGGGFATALHYGGKAGAYAIDQALQSDASAAQAMGYGAVIATIEGITNTIGVDQMLKLGSTSKLIGWLKNAYKRAGGNALEGVFTSVASHAAEQVILGDKSSFYKAVEEYAQYVPVEEAKRYAWSDYLEDMAFSYLTDRVSGSLQGLGATAFRNAQSKWGGTDTGTGSKKRSTQDYLSHAGDILGTEGLSPAERSALDIYTSQSADLDAMQQQRDLLLQQMNGSLKDKSTLQAIRSQLSSLDTQIQKTKASLYQAENSNTLSGVAQKVKSVTEQSGANKTDKQTLNDNNTLDYSARMSTMESGAVFGAYNDENDPDYSKREGHAERYYTAVKRGDKNSIITAITQNSGTDKSLVEKMYNHLFINKYNLDKGYTNFDADYNIAESMRRLREGKKIEEHDKILIMHESMEYDLMNEQGLSYEEAHEIANAEFNYQEALKKWKKAKKR